MAFSRQTPINDSERVSGTGIFVTSLSDPENPSEEPKTEARYVLRDPDVLGYDVGVPQYQMTMVRNIQAELIADDPHMVTLLHCNKIEKILAIPIFKDGSHADMDAWLRTYADLTAVDHAVAGAGYAMASVKCVNPDDGPGDAYLTTVLSVPSGADKLGVTVLPYDVSGHVVAAAAEITGAALGFSGSELTEWRWTGFAAVRNPNDGDLINVVAGLEKMDFVRSGPGDLRGSANYVFTVRESDGSLVAPATLIQVDIPFTPHQAASGLTPSGGAVWCVGRADPEFVNPTSLPRMPSVTATNALTLSGSIGIWASADDQLIEWQRVYESPIGISSPPIHHLDSAVVPHTEVPRDVGLMYNPTYQRLSHYTIDNDPAQDPVTETPRRSLLPPM